MHYLEFPSPRKLAPHKNRGYFTHCNFTVVQYNCYFPLTFSMTLHDNERAILHMGYFAQGNIVFDCSSFLINSLGLERDKIEDYQICQNLKKLPNYRANNLLTLFMHRFSWMYRGCYIGQLPFILNDVLYCSKSTSKILKFC